MCFYGRVFWDCKRHEVPAVFLQSCTQAFFTARSERTYLWNHESSKICPICQTTFEDKGKAGTSTERRRPSEEESVKQQEKEAQELVASIGTQPKGQENLVIYADYWVYVAEKYGVGLDAGALVEDEEDQEEDWLNGRWQSELGQIHGSEGQRQGSQG